MCWSSRTTVNDIIFMTVIQCTPNLPRKLPRHSLPESAMADDVVQHLPPVHVLENHIVVVLVDDHFAHAANIRMVKEHRKRSLTQRPDLLRRILRRLLGCRLRGASLLSATTRIDPR